MSNKQAVPQQVYGNQVQLTLVTWCLLKFRAAKSISYEIDDDISVWLNDGTKLFIQVKSGKSNPFLDSSLDIWKSILNWTNRCTEGNSEKFIFLTTKEHRPGNFYEKIIQFQKDNNFDSLHRSLHSTYQKTRNAKIKSTIGNYLDAKSKLQHIFSNAKIMITPDIRTHESIRKEIATYHEFEPSLERMTSGLITWVQKKIEEQSIENPKEIFISAKEFADYHSQLRMTLIERIKYNLTPPDITGEQRESLLGNIFIQQLDAIDASEETKEKAITDYHSAQGYIEKMIESDFIMEEDITDEINDLKDNWYNISIGPTIFNDEQKGAEIYSKCMLYKSSPLYLKFKKCEIHQGIYHSLADEIEVWWHPEFKSTFRA